MKLSKYNSFRLAILCGTLEALFTVLFFANLGKLVANDTSQLLQIGMFYSLWLY